MTQSGDPLENAIAERANGILKTEWLYMMKIKDIEECKTILERIVAFYNMERPTTYEYWNADTRGGL